MRFIREADMQGSGGSPDIRQFTADDARNLMKSVQKARDQLALTELPEILQRIKAAAEKGNSTLILDYVILPILANELRSRKYGFRVTITSLREYLNTTHTTISW